MVFGPLLGDLIDYSPHGPMVDPLRFFSPCRSVVFATEALREFRLEIEGVGRWMRENREVLAQLTAAERLVLAAIGSRTPDSARSLEDAGISARQAEAVAGSSAAPWSRAAP